MGESSTINLDQLNPLYSQIADIRLKKLGYGNYSRRINEFESSNDLILLNRQANPYCQFEKIEMIESVFEPFPKGSLIVRDTSDIVTYIKDNNYKAIYIKTIDGRIGVFEITSVSYLNNAASESDETYVSINFSNFIYFDSESTSLTTALDYPLPYVDTIYSIIFSSLSSTSKLLGENTYNRSAVINTANYALYKPLNTTESRTHFSNDSVITYCNYLSMYALPDFTTFPSLLYCAPRFLFWTGWNFLDSTGNNATTQPYLGSCYLKYFFNQVKNDAVENQQLETLKLRYSVYDSDSPSINITIDGEEKPYKKIYNLTALPATQIKSTRYFYVRKTPKILNSTKGNTYSNLIFQFQDEGEKYDYEIITSRGVTAYIPVGSTEMFDNGNWGYYDSFSSLDKTSNPTHISNNFGYGTKYFNMNFGRGINPPESLVKVMPYVDCAEMWKNQFDLTPVDPNLGKYGSPASPSNVRDSFLQKVIKIRYQVFIENFGQDKQLEHIRKLERQNFVAYVLCCLKEQKEESFFAALLGYDVMDASPYYDQRGVNQEPLKYRYAWARLKIIDDETAIKLNTTQSEFSWKYSTQYTKWAALENRLWVLDIGDPPIVNGKPNGEWSGHPFGDLRSNYAINLNERTNWYNPTGLTYSNDPLFPFPGQGTTGAKGGYYAPGWHAKSVLDEGFEKIKYRPIGKDIGDLNGLNPNFVPQQLEYPPLYDAENENSPVSAIGACSYVEYRKLHIVRMHKTPMIKLLLNSNITDEKLLNFYDGKFIYWFAAENVMDGPCD